MRVLMIAPHLRSYGPLGGAEQQARKLIQELVKRGAEVKIVTGRWSLAEPRINSIDGVPVTQVFTFWNMGNTKGLRRFATYTYMISLFAHLVKHISSYDIIHIHSLSPSAFVGVLAGKLLKKISICKVMAGGQWSDLKRMASNSIAPGSRYMLPFIQRYCDRVIALNNEISDELKDAGYSPDKIVQIPNGVVIDNNRKQDYALNLPARLVYVGRLDRQKGVDILLQALHYLAKQRPTLAWQLQLFGEGSSRSEYQELAKELGIAQFVQFKGYSSDLGEHLTTSDIFVLPSRAEGMSNALLEAMAAALPCIATNISGNRDLIASEQNGMLVPPDDPRALATALIALLDSQSLREKLASRARNTTNEHYSIESVADKYVNLYRQLLKPSLPRIELKKGV